MSMDNRNMFFTVEELDVGMAQSACDALDDIKNTLNFSIINRLDIRHRTRLGGEIVLQHLPKDDRLAIRDLIDGRRKWHLFSADTLPHDGSYETVVTLQMGLITCAEARPFGFIEGDGSVARLVSPKQGQEDTLTTSGRQQFDAHIDHAWARFPWEVDDGRPMIPEYLSLGGYINPNRVGTKFADPLDVLPFLSEKNRYVLEQPEWSMPAPSSINPPILATRLPIVTRGPDRLPVIRLNPRIICETHRARDALSELEAVLANDKLWTEIILMPGDIVVARGTALHKRGAVTGPRELAAIYGRHYATNSRTISSANEHLEPVR